MAKQNSTHTITVQASTERLSEVRDFVAEHAQAFGFEEDDIADIRLAVDEAFTNIIKHAYDNVDGKSVKISLTHNSDTFGISLFDSGKSFSLENYEKPDIREKIKKKKRGGVGVYLIQSLMDKVTYRHDGAKNEIRMTKKR